MSCYDMEAGTITLPAAAVPAVKKAVRDAQNSYRQTVLAEAARFWELGAKKTRSAKRYRERLDAWLFPSTTGFGSRQTNVRGIEGDQLDLLHDLLSGLADKPRKLQAKDLAAAPYLGLLKATARTTVFVVGEASISFDGRKVTWKVYENNRAVEHAHEHPVARAFFAALGRVKWTRGAGGVIHYRSENTPMEQPAMITYRYPPPPPPPRQYRPLARGW